MVGPLGFALAAMLAVAGLVVVVAGFRGFGFSPSKSRRDVDTGDVSLRVGLACGAFLGTWLATGWPVAATYAAAAGAFAPSILKARRERDASIERVDAIAGWIETVRDTMSASAGIEQALRVTALTVPKPIEREVRHLSLNLQHRSTGDALREFAADVRHPVADMVVASLLLATSRQAGSLAEILSSVAKEARAYAAMARQVETARTRTYSQARMVGLITSGMIVISIVTRRESLEPFDTVTGQMVLFIIFGLLYGAWFVLYKMSKAAPPQRVLEGVERWSPVTAEVGGRTPNAETPDSETLGSNVVNGRKVGTR